VVDTSNYLAKQNMCIADYGLRLIVLTNIGSTS